MTPFARLISAAAIFTIAGMTPLLLPAAAHAQGFSATSRRVLVEGDGLNDLFLSRRVRIWSEDGVNYRLNLAGCEFAVGPDEMPPSSRARTQVYLDLEGPTLFRAHMAAVRRVDIAQPMFRGMRCDPAGDYIMSIHDSRWNSERSFTIKVTQYRNEGEHRHTPASGDAASWFFGLSSTRRTDAVWEVDMEPDWFTPQTEQDLRRLGRVGLAILEAIATRRGSRR